MFSCNTHVQYWIVKVNFGTLGGIMQFEAVAGCSLFLYKLLEQNVLLDG